METLYFLVVLVSLALYLALFYLVVLLGAKRELGSKNTFLISLLLTPLVGFIAVSLSKARETSAYELDGLPWYFNLIGVVVGAATSMLFVQMGDMASGQMYPPPPVTDFHNMESIKLMMSNMSVGAFLIMLAGYAVAAFVGGLVATFISKRENRRPALIVAALLMFGGLANAAMIPGHPVWFIAASILIYAAFAYLGYLAARKRA